MVDRLGHSKSYWTVLAKYPFFKEICKLPLTPLTLYNRHLTHDLIKQVWEPRMQNHINLPSLKHSNIFVQCLNVYWVDLRECSQRCMTPLCKKFRKEIWEEISLSERPKLRWRFCVHLQTGDFCRVCNVDLRLSGQGKFNLFEGETSKKQKGCR